MADHEELDEEPSCEEQGFLNPTDYLEQAKRRSTYTSLSIPDESINVSGGVDFDADRKGVYVRALALTGIKQMACDIAGVNHLTVTTAMREDEVFAEIAERALAQYKARLENELNHQALEGEWQPIVGRIGRDQDGVIGYQRKKNYDALKMLVQRHIPEYRHGHPGEGGQRPMVLVVPAIMEADAWAAATEGERLTKNPLEGIPGAERLMLTDSRGRKALIEEED